MPKKHQETRGEKKRKEKEKTSDCFGKTCGKILDSIECIRCGGAASIAVERGAARADPRINH